MDVIKAMFLVKNLLSRTKIQAMILTDLKCLEESGKSA